MRLINNIKLKYDRPKAILEIKKAIGCGLASAKSFVDKVLADGQIDATYIGYECGRHVYRYNFVFLQDQEPIWFEQYILESAFEFDIKCDDRPSNENIREPDDATKEALAWRDSLSEKEKEMIKLIGDWDNPITFGYAAVC